MFSKFHIILGHGTDSSTNPPTDYCGMKTINLILQVLLLVYFCNAQSEIFMKNFSKWQRKYNITYSNPATFQKAFTHFRINYKSTLRHQLKYYTYRSDFIMRLNKYAEYNKKTFLNGAKFSDGPATSLFAEFQEPVGISPKAFNLPVYPTPPPSLDYRNLGYVTPVEDQGYTCSSCYAFAAACGIEGQVAKKYGKLNSLSSQNILDCSGRYGNGGCLGGSIGISYKYVLANQGIANQTVYPYAGNVNTCAYNSSILAEKILAYTYVSGDENYLKSVLAAVGPIPVGMKGSLDSFYYYSSGIYDDPNCGGFIDHAVCLVGKL
ncbi:unnamed protein product [Chironomus riparius]|uniref:Peptidase C1A papain C-terminal domain-containing protein n=1 Tax=Chironomus riparius TaxID=315576 RepID=A0A9N9X1P4_9DIPT|nr:unnamed protein product [Chironomus riparius]